MCAMSAARVTACILLVACAAGVAPAGQPAPAHELELPAVAPLAPPATAWDFNEYWEVGQVGPRDFYMAAQGPYLWFQEESMDRLRQVGLLDRFIPGHTNFSYIKNYLPDERARLAEDALRPPRDEAGVGGYLAALEIEADFSVLTEGEALLDRALCTHGRGLPKRRFGPSPRHFDAPAVFLSQHA